MSATILLQCSCGAVEGVLRDVSPRRGTRVTCYCRDCQAFARYLGRDADILDAHGGSDIFQTLPSLLKLTKGADHLACIRLTPKGILRWHTKCCRSPIGNTAPTRALSFVGLLAANLKSGANDPGLDDAIGLSRGAVFKKYAQGDVSDAPSAPVPPLILASVMRMLGARLSGAYKTTPFFDEHGAPAAEPYILSPEERAALDA